MLSVREMALEYVNPIKPYVKIARVDHWFKNVFVLPGIYVCWLFNPKPASEFLPWVLVGLFATSLMASANYVINEYLDQETDRFHPLKKNRPGAQNLLSLNWTILEYFLLASVGLALARWLSPSYFYLGIFFLIMGLIYNVPPVRSKDIIHLDVITESINNPIRFMMGWVLVAPLAVPPASLLIAYWMFGAFLMAVKRLAEYRFIDDPKMAGLYRKSLAHYNEQKLFLAIFLYGLIFAFFSGAFMTKYKYELMLSFPALGFMLAYYLYLGFKPNSPTQKPEALYREVYFMATLLLTTGFILVLFNVDLNLGFLREQISTELSRH